MWACDVYMLRRTGILTIKRGTRQLHLMSSCILELNTWGNGNVILVGRGIRHTSVSMGKPKKSAMRKCNVCTLQNLASPQIGTFLVSKMFTSLPHHFVDVFFLVTLDGLVSLYVA